MKVLISILLLFFSLSSAGQLSNREIRNLKNGKTAEDSGYVYGLPYKNGKRYLFVQGANSSFSHKGELSFDFKMKKCSEVCATRDGRVISARSDSDKGGLKIENLNDGNYIMIQHEDGSVAQYWHLALNGVSVKIGDLVKKGQVIGYSGNTGYSALAHLHFQVNDSSGREILPRFQTKKGIIYLRPGRWYKSIHE